MENKELTMYSKKIYTADTYSYEEIAKLTKKFRDELFNTVKQKTNVDIKRILETQKCEETIPQNFLYEYIKSMYDLAVCVINSDEEDYKKLMKSSIMSNTEIDINNVKNKFFQPVEEIIDKFKDKTRCAASEMAIYDQGMLIAIVNVFK